MDHAAFVSMTIEEPICEFPLLDRDSDWAATLIPVLSPTMVLDPESPRDDGEPEGEKEPPVTPLSGVPAPSSPDSLVETL